MYILIYWLGQNVHSGFPIRLFYQSLVVFNFIQNNFVRLYCDSCHISEYFLKKSKLVDFGVAIFILKSKKKKKVMFQAYNVLLLHQTLHLPMAILLMEKIQIPWKTAKGTQNSSLLKKLKKKKKFCEGRNMKLPEKQQRNKNDICVIQ